MTYNHSVGLGVSLLLAALLFFELAVFGIYRHDTIERWITSVALLGAGIICTYYGIGAF